MSAKIDMIGKRYNHWTVIAEAGRDANSHPRYLCRCDCGVEKTLLGSSVRCGGTRMCASCAVKEQRSKRISRKASKGEARVSEAPAVYVPTCGPRYYLMRGRQAYGLSIAEMARKLKISPLLLDWLEQDDKTVTHPKIVERIAKAYGLTEEQRVGMLPKNYRPGPDYDPDRYALPEEVLSNFTVMPAYVRVWK